MYCSGIALEAEDVFPGPSLSVFFFSSRRRHTRLQGDWSSDVCSSDLTSLPVRPVVRRFARPPSEEHPYGRRPMRSVNLTEKFRLFDDYWSPKIAGELNDSYVKLVKLKGEFVWHHHEREDELFLVVKGRLLLRLRDREVWVNEGEFAIVPKGVEHLPVAPDEVHVLLIEPKSTLNTGNVHNERTVERLDRI